MNSTRLRLSTRLLSSPSTPTPRRPHSHTLQPQPHRQRSRPNYSTTPLPRPKLTQASVWTSLVPKFLRNRSPSTPPAPSSPTPTTSKEWNPASFYIIIFILIGSQAIRMIALKNEYSAYTRSTDAKIRLLREVIEKVKRGEAVDVERLLGKGDEGVEREWEDVLKEIEQEDSLWHRKRKERESVEQQEREQEQNATAKAEVKSASTPKSKDPVVPAVDKDVDTAHQSGAKESTKRKVNFF
ncbi:DUF5321 domain-containing protein [Aspergillus lucknowensis]|uniref:Uncharacterized protein n=1 Tax=Aspergillus lucknowensis TaxID=176173 RepID=A0ABR4LQ26_9EURO